MSTEEDDELAKRQRNAVYDAEDAAEVERESPGETTPPEMDLSEPDASEDRPELGPVEPPPPTPDDVAPPPPGPPEQDFEPYRPSAPEPDYKRSIADALRGATSRKYTPPAALNDDAIAKARSDRQAATGRNDFTRAVQSFLLRKPFEPTPPEDTAADLLSQRRAGEASFDKETGRQLSAAQVLARGLKGEKAPAPKGGLSEYQKYEMDRNARLDSEKKGAAEKKTKEAAEQLERDRAMLQKDFPEYDLSKANEETIKKLLSLRHAKAGESQAKANEDLARAQFGHKKERETEEDVKDLAKTVGSDPSHLQGLLDRLDAAASKPDVPGVGLVDRITPDWASSDEGLQNRNDMREAVRTMLTMKSGKTVTPQEAQDYAKIYGIDGSETAFRQGVKRLRSDISDTVKAKKAGFKPAVVEKFEGAGGTPTPAKPSMEPPKKAEQPPSGAIPPNAKNVKKLKNGKWYYELSDGTPETVGPF